MRYIWNESGSTKTIVLAVIFVGLLIATIQQRSHRIVKIEEEKAVTQQKLLDVNTDDIYTMEIYELLSKTALTKKDGKWWVGSAQVMPNMSAEEKKQAEITAMDYADEDAVMQTLEAIQEGFRDWEIVSVNKEKNIDFRIGALGTKFVLLDEKGDELACFDVGEKSANFTGTYVGICGQDEVYKIPGMLDMIFKRDIGGWRTKQINNLEKDDVVKFQINDVEKGTSVILVKNDDGNWVGTSPRDFIPVSSKLDSLLTLFCNYKAMGFPERRGPSEEGISEVQ
ncbi:DUF4340 domain-containing protein, partial [bacterium]|nr:DUF4340 domain-containing protein [bacterium]